MKKIGILTINDYNNYGNRLQNYALQEVIKSLGVEVETVVNNTNFDYLFQNNETKIEKIKRLASYSPSDIIFKINKKLKNKIQSKTIEEQKREINQAFKVRNKNFMTFTDKNIVETDIVITENDIDDEKLTDYDYFVTGSDQVWNPNFRGASIIDYLAFAPIEKRVSYAASFGVSELPEKHVDNITKWLTEMPNISVREEAGADIVNDLTNKEVPVVADPTLLLSKEEWLSVSEKASNRPDTPYILTYFLGGPSTETKVMLEKIASEKHMKIINLGDKTDLETYKTGPSEFLDYINNADAFLTDSFHGVVFSIIFQTPFVVYERLTSGASMYSRIETILDKFNMRNREKNGFNEDIFSMDFSESYSVLESEYNKSIKYLKNALRIED